MSVFSNLIVGKKESVVDEMLLLNPIQIPLLSMLGGFGNPVRNTLHEWNEDEMYGYKSALAADITDAATTLVLADADERQKFRVGHIIQINEELMKVTAISTGGTYELTVTRGYAGTTAAAATAGESISINFVEGEEGADARTSRYKPRVNKQNYTQIFDDTVEVTGTAAEIEQYGIDKLYEYEKQKKLVELALQLEKACIDGVKYSAGNVRQFAGLKAWIQTNIIDASAADISKKMLNDAVQAVADHAGVAAGNYVFMVSPTQKRKIGALDANSLIIERTDGVRGETVNWVVTDLGEFPVRVNPNLKPDEMIFMDVNRAKVRPLGSRSFFHEYLGKKGDYYSGMVVGEYTFEFKQEKAHSRLTNLKTTW